MGCAILWFLYLPPFPAKKQFWHISKLKHLRHLYRNPQIGEALHMLHLAWSLADSAAKNIKKCKIRGHLFLKTGYVWSTVPMNLCRTGNQTMLCGSCFIQFKKFKASMNSRSFPALSKQLLTEGSTFEPPKEANSPRTLGICMQSCSKSPNLRSVACLCWSAISRNISERGI